MTQESIIQKVQEILTLMDFHDVVVSVQEEESDHEEYKRFHCALTTQSDSRFLIGQHGANLGALQHIINMILRNNNDDAVRGSVVIDVNNYRGEKNMITARTAQEAAEKALREKKPVVLRPMSAYERRIVHTAIALLDGVQTESIGEKDERKVVVKAIGIV